MFCDDKMTSHCMLRLMLFNGECAQIINPGNNPAHHQHDTEHCTTFDLLAGE
jgi:hypothetical protein